MIKDMFNKYSDSSDVSIVRDLSMIIVSCAGFLRYDEMSNIRCQDVTFHADYVQIHINKSKTNQYRDGADILLSKVTYVACPFTTINKYVKTCN